MDLTKVKEKDYPLLSRKRVTFEGEVDKATPSRLELREYIAKKLKTSTDKVIIRHIYTRFGSTKVRVMAHVYDKKEDLDKTEDKATVLKNEPKKEEPKEEKKGEAAPAEQKPAEEKAEKSPAEEKPEEPPSEEKAEEKPAEEAKEESSAEEKKEQS